MLGKFKPEEPTSHQHSFSDAQNATTPSANTAETSRLLQNRLKTSSPHVNAKRIKQLK